MIVHVVDGTYELFRHHFGVPSHVTLWGQEVGATRGVLSSLVGMLDDGATHVGVATDHVIESYRNDLWAGYKTGEGVEPALKTQFPLLEELLDAAGFAVWPQVTHEADDGLAAAAVMAAADPRVEQVQICTPDKDLGQCVTTDGRIVQVDRRKNQIVDRAGVIEKFGVPPESIPDYLALVGDTADGYPGLPGWGAKSAAAVLARYGKIEHIPLTGEWDVAVRGAAKLQATLNEQAENAVLFRHIATVDITAPVSATVDEMEWRGPRPGFDALADRLEVSQGTRRRLETLTRKRS